MPLTSKSHEVRVQHYGAVKALAEITGLDPELAMFVHFQYLLEHGHNITISIGPMTSAKVGEITVTDNTRGMSIKAPDAGFPWAEPIEPARLNE